MNEELDKQLVELVQRSWPPPERPLEEDLWPAMLRRLDRGQPRLSRLEWAFSVLVLMTMLFFPQAALALLYHL